MQKFTEEQNIQLVQLYREQRCLWDPNTNDYKNKVMRTQALQEISDRMALKGFNIKEVKKKIKAIRGTYYLELDKVEKSKNSGTGQVYVPRMKWFNELHSFIKNVAIRRPFVSINENSNDERMSDTETALLEENCEPLKVYVENETAEELPTFDEQKPRIRSKRRRLSGMPQLFPDMTSKSIQIDEECDFDIFGRSVTLQLKKLSEEQAAIAQEKIQSVLTQCKLTDIRARKGNSDPVDSNIKYAIQVVSDDKMYQESH